MEKTLVEKNINFSDPESAERIEREILDFLHNQANPAIAPDIEIRAVRDHSAESASSVRGAIWHLLSRNQIEFTSEFELRLGAAD